MATDHAQWTPQAQEAIDWFMGTEPPSEGFQLQPGVFVSDPGNWWEYMRRDVAIGPTGSRAGALVLDIGKLRKIFEDAK